MDMRMTVQANPGISETLSQKITNTRRAGREAQVVESICLASVSLEITPVLPKKTKKKKPRKQK
jgi:hypothetical protein